MNITPIVGNSLLGPLAANGDSRPPGDYVLQSGVLKQGNPLEQRLAEHVRQRFLTPENLEQHLKVLLNQRASWSIRQPCVQASAPVGYRHRELAWLHAHPLELAQHRERWVVLEGEAIIASEQDYQTAWLRAMATGIRRPLIFFVPGDDAEAFMGV